MVFLLPAEGLSLATAFDLMETARKDYNVQEYSISQPTLEQVVIRTKATHSSQHKEHNTGAGIPAGLRAGTSCAYGARAHAAVERVPTAR
eukprot:4998193-Pyramimonas_sp.AAC.1